MSILATRDRQIETIRRFARPLSDADSDISAILSIVGDASLVLIGEASHGTHDFYALRRELTRRLIRDHGFAGVALEADWPDAYRVNAWVRHQGNDFDADVALSDFQRFPQWMWRNTVVHEFVGWLREENQRRSPARRAGVYGLDLYSLGTSIERVVEYLDRVDPDAAARARERYSCFEFFGNDPEAYAYASTSGAGEPCEDEVVEQLVEMQRHRVEIARQDGHVREDDAFAAEQNARLVVNAEEYYRSMFRGRASSWNLRDTHMDATLRALQDHLSVTRGDQARLVVWAHNSHLGDARATAMGSSGELNLGQLVRERAGDSAVNIGFTTHAGTVIAAQNWGEPGHRRRVNPSIEGSYERLFHDVGTPRFWLDLRGDGELGAALRGPLLERAIGVIYRPETERWSHYFEASLPAQFDAVIHLDETRALTPLEPIRDLAAGELPETYPFASDTPETRVEG